jgi:hypothetical protein
LALGKIGGPAARRALETLVTGDDERLAEAAAEALEELMFNSTRLDDVLLEYSGNSASHRVRASRSEDADLDFTEDDDDLDAADENSDDWDWDDSEGYDDDWDDDADEEDDNFDDEDDEDDLDFDDADLDR